MMSARIQFMLWHGAALLLALCFIVSAPLTRAWAHLGHDCASGAVTAVSEMSGAVSGLMAAHGPHDAFDSSAIERPDLFAAAPSNERHGHGTFVDARPQRGDRTPAACVCGFGCGSCSSASCCSGAVLPPDLVWPKPDSASPVSMAVSTIAPSLFVDPLPRPPNPGRLP